MLWTKVARTVSRNKSLIRKIKEWIHSNNDNNNNNNNKGKVSDARRSTEQGFVCFTGIAARYSGFNE